MKNAVPTFLVGENTWPASWFGWKDTRLANWRWRQYSRSSCDALPATLKSTKPHYRQQGQVCKAGTVITVDVSSEERISDMPGGDNTWPASWLGRKDTRLADWIWRQRSRSLSWPVGWCFKSREAWTSALCRCVDEIFFFSWWNQWTGHPQPPLPTTKPVCKGGTDITFYCEVGRTGACRSTNALQQRCLDQCALKKSERIHLLLLMKK